VRWQAERDTALVAEHRSKVRSEHVSPFGAEAPSPLRDRRPFALQAHCSTRSLLESILSPNRRD